MIIRNYFDATKTGRRVVSPDGNWASTRLVLKEDNMGFSFHITTIFKGADFYMHYQNHLESVYCISGEGEVFTLADEQTHIIVPGSIYILDKNDKHRLRALSEMKLACVFNPPLTGNEVHNKDGAYEIDNG